MINHSERITTLVQGVLAKNALGEDFGFNVSQCFGPAPDGNGGMGFGPVWLVTVSMRNPLLGQNDIAQAAPVPGLVPPNQLIVGTVEQLIKGCREEHSAALNTPMQGQSLEGLLNPDNH